MRTRLAVLVFLVPALAGAAPLQDALPPLPPIGMALPPIGLPLPAINMSLPPLSPPPPSTPTMTVPDRGATPGRGSHDPSRRRHPRPSPVYVVPMYWGYGPSFTGSSAGPVTSPPTSAAEAPPARTVGTVWLDVDPRAGDVYVDGYFVGTIDDLRGALDVEPGPHRIEVRTTGYEAMREDVRVEAGASITLKRALHPEGAAHTPASTPTAPPAAPVVHKPFYFIKGCYLGDVPPTAASLPAGCDPAKAVIVPPR